MKCGAWDMGVSRVRPVCVIAESVGLPSNRTYAHGSVEIHGGDGEAGAAAQAWWLAVQGALLPTAGVMFAMCPFYFLQGGVSVSWRASLGIAGITLAVLAGIGVAWAHLSATVGMPHNIVLLLAWTSLLVSVR